MLIGARDTGEALDAVIADSPGWEGLGDLVARAAVLANPVAADPLNHVLGGYSRFRRYTPRMLDIEASPVAKPLLEAVDVLRSNATARPNGFLRPNSKWSRLLRTQPDHRLWETAVLFHLRDAFRAGDVWLARSRRYGDIKGTNPIRVEIHGKDSDRYKVANCTQAQPFVCGLAYVPHGKIISVSVLRVAQLERGGVNLDFAVVDDVLPSAEHTHKGDRVGETQSIVAAPLQGDVASVGFEKAGIANQTGARDVGVGNQHSSVRNKRSF